MYFDFQSAKQTVFLFLQEMERLLLYYSSYYHELDCKSICVAVSGGSDSLALLFLLSEFARLKQWYLYCVTVDHKLRAKSTEEALFVKDICSKLNVEHHILTWEHDLVIEEGKLENLARQARYKLLEQFCLDKKIQFIATGHNWNDQIETHELRKIKGSSNLGLAGMSQIRSLSENVKILRPLLIFSKEYLKDFLISQNIDWKTDPMNFNDHFQRVTIRKNIETYSKDKLNEISRIIQKLGQKRATIEKKAVDFLLTYVSINNVGYAIVGDFSKFINYKSEIQMEILRRVIWQIGGKEYPVSINENIAKNIINRKINTIGRCLIKIKQNHILVFRENRNIPSMQVKKHKILWDNRFIIDLSALNITSFYNLMVTSYIRNIREEDLSSNLYIPKEAFPGFPCLYQNHKVKYNLEKWEKSIDFLYKANFFDTFCGVNCE